MRPATRLLANVKAARFLEPYSPTGLTGLFTHPAPRSALIYLYSTTLERLKQLPDSSVYRQSTESLTRSRLKVVESIKPEGYDGWAERARKKVSENPDVFNSEEGNLFQDGASHVKVERDGRSFISTKVTDNVDERVEEWDGERDEGAEQEGPSTTTRDADSKAVQRPIPETERETIPWEPEPPLDANQISDMETQIGAGLIEEVIQVAEGELSLVDKMVYSKAWEELEEKAPEGQWRNFERDTGTGETQKP